MSSPGIEHDLMGQGNMVITVIMYPIMVVELGVEWSHGHIIVDYLVTWCGMDTAVEYLAAWVRMNTVR